MRSQTTFLAPSCLPTLQPRIKSPSHPFPLSLLSCLVLWLWSPSTSWCLPKAVPQTPSLQLPSRHLGSLTVSGNKSGQSCIPRPTSESLLILRDSPSISQAAQGDTLCSSPSPTPIPQWVPQLWLQIHPRPNHLPLSHGTLQPSFWSPCFHFCPYNSSQAARGIFF